MKSAIDYDKFWSPAFDTMEDFVFLIDKDFHVARVNKSFLDFTKGRPEDFIGKMCYQVIHDTDTPFDECPHARMLSSGKFEHSEFFEPRLKKWLYVRTTPIFDEDRKLAGSIHMAADVTKFRETAAEQKELQAQLEKRVAALERFQKITVDRELKMKELKAKIIELETKIEKKD
ncbi:MAG: PAS domain-containing protein [Candidatus Omnitrophota bacterium]